MKNAYWDLAYAVASLAVQQQSLDLARRVAARTTRRGSRSARWRPSTSSRPRPRSRRARRPSSSPKRQVAQAEDSLRALIFDPRTPDFWTIKLELTDTPAFQAPAIDVDAAVQERARRSGPTCIQAKNSLEKSDVEHPLLPEPDAAGRERAGELRLAGQGGTQLSSATRLPAAGPIGDRHGRLRRRAEPDRSEPVPDAGASACTFGVPDRHEHARGEPRARAAAVPAGADAAAGTLELQVATQVRDVARQVNTNQKRVEATRAARAAAGAAARGRAEEVRRRHVDELPRLPGAARPRAGAQRRAERDPRLQQVARRLRDRAGGAGRRAAAGGVLHRGRRRRRPPPGTVARRRRAGSTAARVGPARGRAAVPSASCYTPAVPKLSVTIITPQRGGQHRRGARVASRGPTRSSSSTPRAPTTRWRSPGASPTASSSRDWPGYVDQKNHAAALAQPRLDPVARRRRAGHAGAGRRDPGAAGRRARRAAATGCRGVTYLPRALDSDDRLVPRLPAAALRPARAAGGPAATCTNR